jgi:hypothetical protein
MPPQIFTQPPPPSKSTTQRMPHSAGTNQPSRNSSNSKDSHRHEPRNREERPVVGYLHRKEKRIAFSISASAWDVRRRCGSASAARKATAGRGGVGMWEIGKGELVAGSGHFNGCVQGSEAPSTGYERDAIGWRGQRRAVRGPFFSLLKDQRITELQN